MLDRLEAAFYGLPPWAAALTVLLASLVVARVVQVGGDVLVRRVTDRIPGDVDDVVLATLHPAVYVTVLLAGAYAALGPLSLGPTPSELGTNLQDTVLSAGILVWAVTLVRLGGRVSDTVASGDQSDGSVAPILQNVWSAMVAGVSIYALLALWEYDVTPLLASAGILGIVIGFAAKDTVANLFGSLALYADRTYRVGDWVVLDSGERGRVEDISIRSTVLRTRDDVLVTVPNSILNSARVTNESVPRRRRRIRIPVSVAYGTDLDAVEGLLMGVAEAERLALDAPSPRVRVRSLGDDGVELELLCWIRDPVLRGRATHELTSAVYRTFADAGVTIPFPQREVRMVASAAAEQQAAAEPADAATDGGERSDGPRTSSDQRSDGGE